MLNKWIKDLTLVLITTFLLNTYIFIMNDQFSIIGTWEVEISQEEPISGNYYDVIKIKVDGTFEHLTTTQDRHGIYEKKDDQLILYYGDHEFHIYHIFKQSKTIENLSLDCRYKKITFIK